MLKKPHILYYLVIINVNHLIYVMGQWNTNS